MNRDLVGKYRRNLEAALWLTGQCLGKEGAARYIILERPDVRLVVASAIVVSERTCPSR